MYTFFDDYVCYKVVNCIIDKPSFIFGGSQNTEFLFPVAWVAALMSFRVQWEGWWSPVYLETFDYLLFSAGVLDKEYLIAFSLLNNIRTLSNRFSAG